MRKFILLLAAVGICIGSFFLTLWLTEPADSRPPIDRLAGQKVSSDSDLASAVAAAGLLYSKLLLGNVDGISRIDEAKVTIAGWFADPDGDSTPHQLAIFVAGALTTAQTNGERPDVTKAHGLGFGAEKNVAFQVRVDCRPGQKPIVVGLGSDNRFLRLPSPACP